MTNVGSSERVLIEPPLLVHSAAFVGRREQNRECCKAEPIIGKLHARSVAFAAPFVADLLCSIFQLPASQGLRMARAIR